MLGALIRRFRHERKLTQPEMADLLSEHGWKLGATHVSKLETDAANNRNGNHRVEQIEAVARATGYDRWVCYFWAGRIPLDLRVLPDEKLQDHFVRVGMGLLYAAVGAIDLGPDISYDLAARTGLLGNDPEFRAKAEIAALEGGRLKMSGPEERRAEELVSWLHDKHGEIVHRPKATPSVRAVLDAWGAEAVADA